MAISLYDVSIRSFIQTLEAASGFLQKGLDFCLEQGIDPQEIVDMQLAADMFPFRFQVISIAHHSKGAWEGVKAGEFGTPNGAQHLDYAGLQGLVADALTSLKAVTPDEVNAYEGKDVVFKIGDRKMPFLAEGFLMSFSLPNLHFHASTAYGMLRARGAPIGKRDYMGVPRIKM
jgi:hypothetical protein